MKSHNTTFKKILALGLTALTIVATIPYFHPVQEAGAYSYEDVANLNREIAILRNREAELSRKAQAIASENEGFEREKELLRIEVEQLEIQIDVLEVEIQQLLGEIETTEKKIANTQTAISTTLVDLYLTQDVSTIERIASSSSFSSFVDNATKYTAATDGLVKSVEVVKIERTKLERQYNELQAKQLGLSDRRDLAVRRTEELNRIISANKQQQAQFAADRNAAYQQRLELTLYMSQIMSQLGGGMYDGMFSGDKGGYPHRGICPGANSTFVDEWGMYVCQCVSYAAWKVEQFYGIKVRNIIPYWVSLNGGEWPSAFSGYVPMGREPRVFSVASWMDPTGYGHVAWVEYIDGNGHVWVSEYNVKWGDYSERDASLSGGWMAASNATYIYFGQR